jgi:Ca2+-transporting ATPase
LGDAQEALILLGFVFFIIGINLYQEQKTERSLEALRDLSSPRALVISRWGTSCIAVGEVVQGDLIRGGGGRSRSCGCDFAVVYSL